MTSKQVMLTAWLGLVLGLTGCASDSRAKLEAPYPSRQTWAVAPLRNESGTVQADGLKLADKLAQTLETAKGVEVLPVNRVLAAMEQAQLRRLDSRDDALQVLQMLRADGLVLGTISAYDPYEPPKLGLALELYVPAHRATGPPLDLRELSKAPTAQNTEPKHQVAKQPVSAVSAFYNAADPAVREKMKGYAEGRGSVADREGSARLYRISMDLYSEFVSYAMLERLLKAERSRIEPEKPKENAPAS